MEPAYMIIANQTLILDFYWTGAVDLPDTISRFYKPQLTGAFSSCQSLDVE